MPRSRDIAAAALVVAMMLAGCASDRPEESAGPDEATEAPPAEPSPLATPTPPTDGIGSATARVVEAPTPEALPPPTPVEQPPAEQPAAPPPPPEAAPPAPAEPAPPAAQPPAPAQPEPQPEPQPQPEPRPEPEPEPEPAPTWPREGSYVQYTMRTAQSFSGSDQRFTTYSNATWTYTNGDWRGECVATRHDDSDGDGTVEISEERVTFTASDPPHWPLFNTRSPPAVGEPVTTWTMRDCEIDEDEWPYRGTDTEEGMATYKAASAPDEPPYDFSTEWSQESGLVVEWSLYRYMTSAPYSNVGRLVATDAPTG